MAKEVDFTSGTVVTSEFLDNVQELLTGAIWGLFLEAGSTGAKINASLDPTVSSAPMTIDDGTDYKVGIISGAGEDSTAASGAADTTLDIYASTTDGIAPSVNISISDSAPADPFARIIGSAYYSGGAISNVKLLNGVHANANQFNSFTFRTALDLAGDIPVTIRGRNGQSASTTKMLSVGHDVGGTYTEKWYLSSTGRITANTGAGTDVVLRSLVTGDSVNRFTLDTAGKASWGAGSGAVDTTLERTAAGVLKIGSTLDVATIQNSGSGGADSGSVNISDSLNLSSGSVYKINGSQIASANLSDTANIVLLSGSQTLTGAKTFTLGIVASGGVASAGAISVTGASAVRYERRASGSGTDDTLVTKVTGDANERFVLATSGAMSWGDGTATQDVTLSRTAANILAMGSGDKLQQNAAPTTGDDLVNKTYADTFLLKAGGTVTGGVTMNADLTMGTASSNTPYKIISAVTNNAAAVGIILDTPSYTTSGAKLLSVRNNGVEKIAINKDGGIVFADATVQTTAFVANTYAPIASPVFTGNPTSTTNPSAGDNDQSIPTTSWVQGELTTSLANRAIDSQGTFAARPAAGTAGRYYWDTTNSLLYRDNGSSWVTVGPYTLATDSVTAVHVAPDTLTYTEMNSTLKPNGGVNDSTPTYRALGFTAGTAVPGNDTTKLPTTDMRAALAGTDGAPSASNKYVTASDDRLAPTGAIVAWPTNTLPTGWTWANGASLNSVSNTEYADLYALIGVTYGGSGASAFNVPDLCGRVPVGRDNMGGITAKGRISTSGTNKPTSLNIGTAFGDEDHTLTIAQLPAHNHGTSGGSSGTHPTATTASEPAHAHGAGTLAAKAASTATDGASDTSADWGTSAGDFTIAMSGSTANAGGHDHTVTLSSVGSGSSHNNLQPGIFLNWIIKL